MHTHSRKVIKESSDIIKYSLLISYIDIYIERKIIHNQRSNSNKLERSHGYMEIRRSNSTLSNSTHPKKIPVQCFPNKIGPSLLAEK